MYGAASGTVPAGTGLAEHTGTSAERDGVTAERDGVTAGRDGLAAGRDGVAADHPPFDAEGARAAVAARWAGTPLAVEHWLEGPSGFPPGSVGGADPAPATEVVAASRGISLTRRQVDDVLAFAEFLAGRALPYADRDELTDDIVDAFTDAPRDAARSLRSLAGGVRRVTGLDPAGRAQRRLQALTTTYTIEQRRRADGADPSPVMAVVGRHNPAVRHWASTGVVLVADALAARVDQHRLVLSLVGGEVADAEALTGRLLARTEHAGRLEIAELAAAELRLLHVRSWLRGLGERALAALRDELARAVPSALDVDIVVQQVGHRAALDLAARR